MVYTSYKLRVDTVIPLHVIIRSCPYVKGQTIKCREVMIKERVTRAVINERREEGGKRSGGVSGLSDVVGVHLIRRCPEDVY